MPKARHAISPRPPARRIIRGLDDTKLAVDDLLYKRCLGAFKAYHRYRDSKLVEILPYSRNMARWFNYIWRAFEKCRLDNIPELKGWSGAEISIHESFDQADRVIRTPTDKQRRENTSQLVFRFGTEGVMGSDTPTDNEGNNEAVS